MSYLNTASFGSHEVCISVDHYNNIQFTVDESFFISENKHKVAITRWLLQEFKRIQGNYKYLLCIAWDEDAHWYNRVRIYEKIGFINLKNSGFIYLNFSSKEEQDKQVNELLSKCPEEFSPLTKIEEEGFFYLWVERTIPELGFYEPVPLPIEKRVHLRRRRRS